MGNEKQDRVRDQRFTPNSLSEVPEVYAGPTVLSLGFFRQKNLLESELSWDTASSEIWLLRDLLKASGSEPGTLKDGIFAANFPDVLSAILCARRVQWALHGLAQDENRECTSATILIHSIEVEQEQTGVRSIILGNEEQGKILIEKRVSGLLDALSGTVANRAFGPFLEVIWDDCLTDLDPEFLKSALRIPDQHEAKSGIACPLEDLVPSLEPIASDEMPPSLSTYDGPFGSEEEPGRWKAFKSRNWLIAAGSGMLAILLIILIVVQARKSGQVASSSQLAPSSQVATQPSPSLTAPPTPAPAPAATARSIEAPRQSAKAPKHEPKNPKLPKPDENTVKAVKGSCDLSEAEIDRNLKRAENYLHAGNFAQALQAYRQVIDCPSSHEKAQQGITSTKLKMSLQGQSDPNE
jgi:hypothetical protein